MLTIEDLSVRLGKAISSIYSDLQRNPESLPPLFRPPKSKALRWRPEDVKAWEESHVVRHHLSEEQQPAQPRRTVPQPKPQPLPRKKGRPTKTERLAKAALKGE